MGCLDGELFLPEYFDNYERCRYLGHPRSQLGGRRIYLGCRTGPGLTTADIASILTFDPLVPSNDYKLLSSFPSTTSDGRFTKEPFPPNDIQYPVGGATEMYNTVQTNTQSVASGASATIKQAFGVSEEFGTNFFDIFSAQPL